MPRRFVPQVCGGNPFAKAVPTSGLCKESLCQAVRASGRRWEFVCHDGAWHRPRRGVAPRAARERMGRGPVRHVCRPRDVTWFPQLQPWGAVFQVSHWRGLRAVRVPFQRVVCACCFRACCARVVSARAVPARGVCVLFWRVLFQRVLFRRVLHVAVPAQSGGNMGSGLVSNGFAEVLDSSDWRDEVQFRGVQEPPTKRLDLSDAVQELHGQGPGYG